MRFLLTGSRARGSTGLRPRVVPVARGEVPRLLEAVPLRVSVHEDERGTFLVPPGSEFRQRIGAHAGTGAPRSGMDMVPRAVVGEFRQVDALRRASDRSQGEEAAGGRQEVVRAVAGGADG